MEFLTLENFLKKFYELNKSHLENVYSGISFNRLKQDLKIFLREEDAILDRLYLPSSSSKVNEFCHALLDGTPLEYITHEAYFYKSSFFVNEHVLIPRNETEILVEMAVNEIGDQTARILDLGTGSGAIVLSILMDLKNPIEAVASDLSQDALKVARKNYFEHQYKISNAHQITFIQSDKFEKIEGIFDFIFSNPPYIKRTADLDAVHDSVKKLEPHLALYLDDEIYDQWFIDFFKGIDKHLKKAGVAIVEGHEDHLINLQKIASKVGPFNVIVVKDYTNRDRFLKITKN